MGKENQTNQAMQVSETVIAGVFVVKRVQRGDARGLFERIYDASLLEPFGWKSGIAQVNHSYTKERGVVRGMHYQAPPYSEWKLVSCLRGEVWDVALDLRADSPTFLQHTTCLLSAENGLALLIPPGCAHGFQTMCADVDMLYCHSEAYQPEYDCGVHVDDPKFNIAWPLEITQRSARDLQFPFVPDDYKGA